MIVNNLILKIFYANMLPTNIQILYNSSIPKCSGMNRGKETMQSLLLLSYYDAPSAVIGCLVVIFGGESVTAAVT